jgi:predicted ATPase/DNA-binding SARP family transcriptional activator
MRIALLGELEVLDDAGAEIPVTGAKLRALLAALALQVGRPVPADQLIDALWGEDPPPAVKNGLQGLVSKLRRALGSTELVSMRSGGYVLELDEEAVDVHRFARLVAAGQQATDPDEVIALLAEAELLWRGDALAEFAYEDFASLPAARLQELRLAAVEERLDAEVARGNHSAVVVELEDAVATHPLRERLRALLMLALYRSGRQADALRVFQEGRAILGEELGLEPGPELRRAEAAILAHDPELDAPAPSAPPSARAILPAPLTPLVGRAEEVATLTALVDAHRLVTLVGPGGVGKTRLAVEVGRLRAADLPHGGCLVELAPVGDPTGVRTAVASALDLPDPDRLIEVLADRELVLLLDNCEHVISAAAEAVEDVLRHCPGVSVIATSREGLRIPGEELWTVPPLTPVDAGALFVARARSVGAALEETEDERALIEEICTRLDGLPLAIELAAARTRAFTIHHVASRLHDRFRLLTGGSRTALPRQQTLSAVVDWSYDLLFEDEQRVFERLSVFPGGCDLATAAAVCADDDLPAGELEDIIPALVEKSLVIPASVAGDPRVTQLQTLAQYGREKLAQRGDAVRIRDAMAAHFADLCAGSISAFAGGEQRRWLIAIDRERENLRAALDWAIDRDDAETALIIAGGCSWPHWLGGTVAEGRQWLDRAFALDGPVSEHTDALARTGRALLTFQGGGREGVDEDLGVALATFTRLGDHRAMGWTYSFWAEVALVAGDREEARRRRLEVLTFQENRPDDFRAVGCAYSRAKLAQIDGDLAEAERHYRDAADELTRIDRPVVRAMALGMVAEFDERAERYDAAIANLQEAVDISASLGLRGFLGSLQARLAWALLHRGDVSRAEEVYRRALDVARPLGNRPVMALSLAGLAAIHHLHGQDREAATAATEALRLHDQIGPRRMANRTSGHAEEAAGAAVSRTVLASIAAAAGDPAVAVEELARADDLRRAASAPVPPFQHDDVERIRALTT